MDTEILMDTEPSTGKNDGFWLPWGICKENIKQNIIMVMLRKAESNIKCFWLEDICFKQLVDDAAIFTIMITIFSQKIHNIWCFNFYLWHCNARGFLKFSKNSFKNTTNGLIKKIFLMNIKGTELKGGRVHLTTPHPMTMRKQQKRTKRRFNI